MDQVTLRHIDSELEQFCANVGALDEFGDRLDPYDSRDLAETAYCCMIERIVEQPCDELPVDLQIVDWQHP
jgi:hypothetical protein